MKGFIKKTLAALSLAGGLGCFAGCTSTLQETYGHCVDPCWPQRYTAMASDSVSSAFAPQVENGHVLDQTVWNSHFERGSAVLTPGGMMHLTYLSRTRPSADSHIFLQTSYDLPLAYDPAAPAKFAVDRAALDDARRKAVIDFLYAQTAGRGLVWEVTVHDPGEVGLHSVPMLKTIADFHGSFRGALPIGGGGGPAAGAGISNR